MQTQPNGWQYFVSTLLIVTGAINVIQGLAAMFTPDFYIASETQMLVLEYGAWGVLLGLWGVVLVVAGLAILSGSAWARAFAIVLAAMNAIAQLAFLIAMPLWSVVVIAIDVLVIYGLTAAWPAAIRGEDPESSRESGHRSSYRAGYQAAHEKPTATPRPTASPEHGSAQGQGPARGRGQGSGSGQHQQPTS
ncbi:hypothetical protein NE857_24510 [Nocardiopsis exhalans]|uniref:DUF7144 domain-containing protein n=1 Tax=Nocardiopsis exhalans TaxID=163604 RepID=A0ABY5D5L6_9ACTN|nr:hypothetical protein [Nocardiopsis exhalans]USY18446.1 hypothetical protein NE857_24510 [Nocardiopsis exhalans]